MTTCNKGLIVDVDCVYEDGKFIIGTTDACATDLFTVRFRAPTDYQAGDVIVFREKKLPVRTPGMASATTDIFKTGAIVHADIDLVSRRAFVWMGGVGGALPNLSYEEQFAGFYDVDGSKVYVKTIDFGPLTNALVQHYPHGIVNMKSVIMDVFRISSAAVNTLFLTHASIGSTNVSHISYGYDGANVNLTTNHNALNRGWSGRVILWYTCTDR